MSGYQFFCPRCYGVEIAVEATGVQLVGVEPRGGAKCLLCGWAGLRADLVAGITPANHEFWTSDRVANALLTAAARHCAGPMVQILEMLGLAPRVEGDEEQQASAQHVREGIVKAVLESVVTAAFQAAGELTLPHFQRFDPELTGPVERVFQYEEPQ
jgi:hypothetical protein